MSDKMREEFETWCKGKYPNAYFGICKKEDGYRYSIGQYVDADVHTRWDAWQASRSAVVIELPAYRKIRHMPIPDENESYNEAIDNCRDAIEAAGLKVKP